MRITEKETIYKTVHFFEGEQPFGVADIEVVGNEVWFNNFAIAEEFRGKGYGQKALIIAITEYGINTLTCAVKNEVAFHIYKKYGFEVVEEWEMFDVGKAYLMKRRK